GEPVLDTLVQGHRYAVQPREGDDLQALLGEALGRLPEGLMSKATAAAAAEETAAEIDFSGEESKEGSFYITREGDLMQFRGGAGRAPQRMVSGKPRGLNQKEAAIVRKLIPVRDAYREVLSWDVMANEGTPALKSKAQTEAPKARAKLKRAYNAFVKEHGPINQKNVTFKRPTKVQLETARAAARAAAHDSGTAWREGDFDDTAYVRRGDRKTVIASAREKARQRAQSQGRVFDEGSFDPSEVPMNEVASYPNLEPIRYDPESYRLAALEEVDSVTGEVQPGRVFTESVISGTPPPTIDSAEDAVMASMNAIGRFDIDDVAGVWGQDVDATVAALGDKVFSDPATGQWLMSDEYLSGKVKDKLRTAVQAAETDPQYRRNVTALERVQPIPIPAGQIGIGAGAPWLPPAVYDRFGSEVLDMYQVAVSKDRLKNEWRVAGQGSAAAEAEWATKERNVRSLYESVLARREIKVYDRHPDGSSTLNPEATKRANEKAGAIRQAFSDWVFQDETRKNELVALYSEIYNDLADRRYDGSWLTTPGVAAHWIWRPYQKDAMARIILSGNTLLNLAVGSGKTGIIIGAVMELRRLGLARKPMVVVPNHMLGQFTREWYQQYPQARVMVADEEQFHGSRRKQFVANAAVSDVDALILTYEAFKMLPVSRSFRDMQDEKEVAEFEDMLRDEKANRTRKQIEKAIERKRNKIAKQREKKEDETLTFEETGADMLFVALVSVYPIGSILVGLGL
ncbi:MAG: DEAD/DEAH box helicase family protein, partial [Gammaproteobacteria bacterium]|nr:DEAD/DEAH box helicase family protein [Gammaproteobacteria bacterium]